MLINYDYLFSDQCKDELRKRQQGNTFYGPPKVYGIVTCEIDQVILGDLMTNERQEAAIFATILDSLVVLIFYFSAIRLKWYEKVAVSDMKKGKVKLEDFAVYVPQIPINKKHYNNNPDLLTAQLAVHMEEIVGHELQVIGDLFEI